jgi:hypothetical protein
MPPKRTLSHASHSPTYIRDLFLGLAFQLGPAPSSNQSQSQSQSQSQGQDGDGDGDGSEKPEDNTSKERQLEYATVIHDGTGVIESHTFTTGFNPKGQSDDELAAETKKVTREILEKIREMETVMGAKVSVGAFLWSRWCDGRRKARTARSFSPPLAALSPMLDGPPETVDGRKVHAQGSS